jgi:hypothetical protein
MRQIYQIAPSRAGEGETVLAQDKGQDAGKGAAAAEKKCEKGTITEIRDSFDLSGWPALVLFVRIVVYFYVGRRIAGGTLWDRFYGITRPQPR